MVSPIHLKSHFTRELGKKRACACFSIIIGHLSYEPAGMYGEVCSVEEHAILEGVDGFVA
jgi:hypothetical protein